MADQRLSATKFIWVAFIFALAFTNANVFIFRQDPNAANVLMALAFTMAATGSTIAIWTSKNIFSDSDTGDTKLKRGERVKRLIDLMDDDELYELRERLSTDYSTPTEDYVVLGADGELHRKQKSG